MENILGKVTSVKSDENGLYIQLEPSEEGKRFFYELFKKEEEHVMTCREKLKLEHPDYIDHDFHGGCLGCPNDYGYLDKPDYCESKHEICTICWDREISEEKPKEAHPWGRILGFIDDAMAKRDREVHLYFNPDTGITLNVYPWPENDSKEETEDATSDKAFEEFMFRIFCEGKISANLFRRVMGYDPI